ncbi:cytochrome bd function ABC transporter ATP-binding protein [Niallia circulans]|uniref:thiol reductant ABC exporter subunit CydC n=1 Tax=Niallia circulans TaxID=1397 RepID=UPI00077C2123|nr:thiol reductant ABC exporter subunit CydC [Niallia circulans]MDR4316868.1 thiol reductant ABC exporter subunit CydC [Niallia circulans]MED3840136.1 thiol reductant ABC exporter subunit CydC [Niallia circulans]MED4241824.1 thiol reductant ABC exporter subunit CydC [Niallia circulans]MED4250226.1 thiol reductant ABC exporter subunit CydC [Niallia circulans]QKH63568.1 thiol reductant ABC exporter subunit CydC [Niallia circulans]
MNENKWISPFLKANSGRIVLILFLSVLALLTAAMLTFTSGFLISKSAIPVENILMVYVPIVGVRTFGISRAVFSYLEKLAGHHTVLRILSKMRMKLYQILEPQALFLKSRFKVGDMLGILSDDIEKLQNIYLRTIFPTFATSVLYIIVVCAIGILDIPFAILMAIYLGLLLFVFPILSLVLMRKNQREFKQRRNGLYQKLTDSILGISDWVISGRSKGFIEEYEKEEAIVAQLNYKLVQFTRWRNFASQAVAALIILSLIFWSSKQYIDGAIPVTLIAAIILVALPILDAFLVVSDAFEKLPAYQDSLDRLNKLNVPEQKNERVRPIIDTDIVDIQVDQITYQYEKEQTSSLSNVSLDIPQGKKIAIIGRSGAGKSTLLKLIQGVIQPTTGRVTYNGETSASFHADTSSIISVLNQTPHLFATTLRNNILLGVEEASDKELIKAIKSAQLEELVSSLPNGLDTFMEETGQRFSGGERQRVALARILLQKTPIVIMDEPNASLDPKTEKALLKTIFTTLEGKTMIWITHHLVGVEEMDEIIFMDQGEIVLRGSHQELLATSSRYQQLYALDHPE